MGHDAGEGVGVDRICACLDAVLQQTQGAGPGTTHVTIPIAVMDDVARALEAAARTTPAQGEAEALRREVEGLRRLLNAPGRRAMGFHERHAVLYARATAAERARDEAVAVLRRVEWVIDEPAPSSRWAGEGRCPICSTFQTEAAGTHTSDCALAAALANGTTTETEEGYGRG